MDDTPFRVCQLASARMLQAQFDLRFPLVHADERPQSADASFDFAISDAGRLSGAIPIDGSQKWRGSSDLAVHAIRVPASASDAGRKRPTVHLARVRESAGGTGMVLSTTRTATAQRSGVIVDQVAIPALSDPSQTWRG
jgi:hypothetical protein